MRHWLISFWSLVIGFSLETLVNGKILIDRLEAINRVLEQLNLKEDMNDWLNKGDDSNE
jgi:hypothetical protein